MKKNPFWVASIAFLLASYSLSSFGQEKKQGSQTAPAPIALSEIKAVTPVLIKTSEMSTNLSDDKLAATLNFNGIEAIVAGESGDTPINSAFLEVAQSKPVGDGHRELIGYTVDIRGNFDFDPMARGSVILIFDGQAETLEFPYPPKKPIDPRDAGDVDDTEDGHRAGDFDKRYFFLAHRSGSETRVTSPLRLQVIVQVIGSSEDRATLIVDGIDLEARTAAGGPVDQ